MEENIYSCFSLEDLNVFRHNIYSKLRHWHNSNVDTVIRNTNIDYLEKEFQEVNKASKVLNKEM